MIEGQGAWRIRTEGTGYCCRHWVFEREQESIVRWVFFFVRGESLLRHFLCFSFGSSRRGKIVSRNKEALTFRWRRRGARDSGGDVVSMCNVSMCNVGMYRSLRDGACSSGARSAQRQSWRRRRFDRRRSRYIGSPGRNRSEHQPWIDQQRWEIL